jgi:hypothetical protein
VLLLYISETTVYDVPDYLANAVKDMAAAGRLEECVRMILKVRVC